MSVFRLKPFPLAMLFGLAACAGSPASTNQDPLAGTQWQLQSIASKGQPDVTPDDPAKYTLAFDTQGQVNLRVDCNRQGGNYRIHPLQQLEFGPLRSTMAYCGEASLHDRMSRDMTNVQSFRLENGALHLILESGVTVYRFTPDAPSLNP